MWSCMYRIWRACMYMYSTRCFYHWPTRSHFSVFFGPAFFTFTSRDKVCTVYMPDIHMYTCSFRLVILYLRPTRRFLPFHLKLDFIWEHAPVINVKFMEIQISELVHACSIYPRRKSFLTWVWMNQLFLPKSATIICIFHSFISLKTN